MWRDKETGRVVTRHDAIRALRPFTALPVLLTDDWIELIGFDPVQTTVPVFDPETQVATQGAPVQVDGKWVQTWVVTDLHPDEIADRTAYKAGKLAEAKVKKNSAINHWREQANYSVFPHAGKMIACDLLSRSDIDAVASHINLFGTFPDGFPMGWKTKDETYIPLPDIPAFKAMFRSMTAQGTANFNKSQQLKAVLAAAITEDEVNAITWD